MRTKVPIFRISESTRRNKRRNEKERKERKHGVASTSNVNVTLIRKRLEREIRITSQRESGQLPEEWLNGV